MRASLMGQKIKIQFPFNPKSLQTIDTLQKVKTLLGRRYHREGRFWSCPLTVKSAQQLKEWGFQLDPKLEHFLQSKLHPTPPKPIPTIPGLRGELYPFQNIGVSFIESRQGRALIGDEMGLGKTVETLAWLQLHPEKRPAIIVCPASLKLNWEEEIQRWIERRPENIPQVLSGTKPSGGFIHGKILIINYDILHAWTEKIQKLHPQVIILDEAHLTKNRKAKRTKAVNIIARNVPHIIGLTGTPITSRPVEFFNTLHLIDPTLFPDFWTYAHRYCDPHHNGYGWNFKGASNTEELHQLLTRTIMLRRRKEEVLQELPSKIRSAIPIELTNKEEYKLAERDFITWIQSVGKAKVGVKIQALAKIEYLKQIALKGKISQCIQWIKDFLEVEDKLIVFAIHRNTINTLMQEFKGVAVKVDGSVTKEKRQEAVQAFQSNPNYKLFIGNIKAAGVGLTLTASSNVVFLELPWTPGELGQAEDRAHRIGQKKAVNIYYLLARGTIEEKIAKLLDIKKKVLGRVLDGQEVGEETLLTTLLASYEKRKGGE